MTGHTYRQEIELARDRLRGFLVKATRPGWERTEDTHGTGAPKEYGIWSEGRGQYVAEHVRSEADARYLELADTGFGERVRWLLTAVLDSDDDGLDATEGHEECQGDGTCVIGGAVSLARYINRERGEGWIPAGS